jgi:hypothetical protein
MSEPEVEPPEVPPELLEAEVVTVGGLIERTLVVVLGSSVVSGALVVVGVGLGLEEEVRMVVSRDLLVVVEDEEDVDVERVGANCAPDFTLLDDAWVSEEEEEEEASFVVDVASVAEEPVIAVAGSDPGAWAGCVAWGIWLEVGLPQALDAISSEFAWLLGSITDPQGSLPIPLPGQPKCWRQRATQSFDPRCFRAHEGPAETTDTDKSRARRKLADRSWTIAIARRMSVSEMRDEEKRKVKERFRKEQTTRCCSLYVPEQRNPDDS